MLKRGSRRGTKEPSVTPGLGDPKTGLSASSGLNDPETGLANTTHLFEVLQRDIARAERYGHGVALVTVRVVVTEFEAPSGSAASPSPAIPVATVLRDAVRQGDFVARPGKDLFAVILPECSEPDAVQFSERVRTKLSSEPFARDGAGKGVYMRAWAGVTTWGPEYDSAERFLAAAVERLEASYIDLASEQAWYKGAY